MIISSIHRNNSRTFFPGEHLESARDLAKRVEIITRATEIDFETEQLIQKSIPVESPTTEYKSQTHMVREFTGFYRRPRYLVITGNESETLGITGLLNCFCMRFYAEKFTEADTNYVLSTDSDQLKKYFERNNLEIAVIYNGWRYDFRKIAASLKEKVPHIPVLVYCGIVCQKDAESLREEGFFAFNNDEACYQQQFMDKLIATALGKEGLERLRISPLILDC